MLEIEFDENQGLEGKLLKFKCYAKDNEFLESQEKEDKDMYDLATMLSMIHCVYYTWMKNNKELANDFKNMLKNYCKNDYLFMMPEERQDVLSNKLSKLKDELNLRKELFELLKSITED